MPTCCAPGCNRTEKTNPELSFFSLPQELRRLCVWKAKLKLVTDPAPSAKICRLNFEDRFVYLDPKYTIAPHIYKSRKYQLTDDSYLSIFEHSSKPQGRKSSENRAAKRQKIELLKECVASNAELECPSNGDTTVTPDQAELHFVEDNSSRSEYQMCTCRCWCERCTIREKKSVHTQTEWPSKVKAVQVKPKTAVKGTMCRTDFKHQEIQVNVETADSATHTDSSSDDTIFNIDACEDSELSEGSDTEYCPSEDPSADDSPVKPQQRPHLVHPENSDEQRKFLVFENSLLELFQRCPECGVDNLEAEIGSTSGTLVRVLYSCRMGHRGSWLSQPLINGRMAVGNLLVSAAILFTGSSFGKIQELSEVLRLPFISEKHFYELQSMYLFPVLHTLYTSQKEALIAAYGGDPMTLVGDGRCDSPGFSAKYGTYTLMEEKSGIIVTFSLKQLGLSQSSVAMETDGLADALTELNDHGMNIQIIGTDCSRSVAKVIRESFPNIQHEHDVYHVEKRIKKKLNIKANQRGHHAIHAWIKPISNHLWWVAQNCDFNDMKLKEMWLSLAYHVSNRHEWAMFDIYHKCSHDPLPTEVRQKKKWLKTGSETYDVVCNIIQDPVLVKDIQKLTRAIHTGQLESYHSVLLKYCPKRQHFSYKGMMARTELAVIDHNFNLGRNQATTADGTLRFYTAFPKRTKDWVAKPIHIPKSHTWRHNLTKCVLLYKLGKMQDVIDIPIPDELPQNIASAEKPSKEEVVSKHQSRFKDRKALE